MQVMDFPRFKVALLAKLPEIEEKYPNHLFLTDDNEHWLSVSMTNTADCYGSVTFYCQRTDVMIIDKVVNISIGEDARQKITNVVGKNASGHHEFVMEIVLSLFNL